LSRINAISRLPMMPIVHFGLLLWWQYSGDH